MTIAAILRRLLGPGRTHRPGNGALAPCDARLDVMPCPACGAYAAFDRPVACGARDCPWAGLAPR